MLELLCDELAGVELIYDVEETHELGLVSWQHLQVIYQVVPLIVAEQCQLIYFLTISDF